MPLYLNTKSDREQFQVQRLLEPFCCCAKVQLSFFYELQHMFIKKYNYTFILKLQKKTTKIKKAIMDILNFHIDFKVICMNLLRLFP